MPQRKKAINRRKFIRTGLQGAGLIGLGSASGLVASRYLVFSPERHGGAVEPTASHTSVDPALLHYSEVQRIKTRFHSPRAIATGLDDRIYIAGDQGIEVFGKDAELLAQIKLKHAPRCLTISADGKIYVGAKNHLEVYNTAYKQEASWNELARDAVLTSIVVSKDDVFVADAGHRAIWRYSISGAPNRCIGRRDKNRNIPGFVVPSPYFDLALAPDGLLRVANPGRHRVEAYTFDGDFEFAWGQAAMAIEGFCGCCNPVNLALLADGSMVTSEKGLARIKTYAVDGTFKGVVAGPQHFVTNGKACCSTGQVTAPLADTSRCQFGGIDVAVNSRDYILALDPIERMLRIFAPIEGQVG